MKTPISTNLTHTNIATTSRASWTAAVVIAVVTAAAYSNSLRGPFIFDDLASIPENASIQRLWPIWEPLCPPRTPAITVTGRPLLNLLLAINYAVGGCDVRGYHLVNLAIHIAAALLLFGIVRRTLLLPSMHDRWGNVATLLAATAALLWAVHPLQTESVTYVIQRAESLLGMFYFLTLYAFIRAAESSRGLFWPTVMTLACLAGMACKEVMVSAPLIVLLYDRTFLAGSFREALRRRYGLYLALAATWPVLEQLIYATHGRGDTVRLNQCLAYLGTQGVAIVRYLKLVVWPRPLVLDYGCEMADNPWQIVPCVAVVGLLVAATAVALWRWPKVGFLGAWFFAILAPTSSFVPMSMQVAAEHRMYLPLASLTVGVACGGWIAMQALVHRRLFSPTAARGLSVCAVVTASATLAILTFQRNWDYQDMLTIWEKTAADAPNNLRAQRCLGCCYAERDRLSDALTYYQRALQMSPGDARTRLYFEMVLDRKGQADEVAAEQARAASSSHDSEKPHHHDGGLLVAKKRYAEAAAYYGGALKIQPNCMESLRCLAWLLASCPYPPVRNGVGAVEFAQRANQLAGVERADLLDALAAAYAEAGRFPEAVATARRAAELAEKQNRPEAAKIIRARLVLYEAGKPFRQ